MDCTIRPPATTASAGRSRGRSMPAAAEMDTANKNGAALKPAIVVTGASSGIGRDIARLAAADRCFLLLLGRSPQALDELVAELAATGAQAAPQEQLNLVDVNIRALTELTLRFLPAMLVRGRGGVLNVGSITGYAAGPNMAAY